MIAYLPQADGFINGAKAKSRLAVKLGEGLVPQGQFGVLTERLGARKKSRHLLGSGLPMG